MKPNSQGASVQPASRPVSLTRAAFFLYNFSGWGYPMNKTYKIAVIAGDGTGPRRPPQVTLLPPQMQGCVWLPCG